MAIASDAQVWQAIRRRRSASASTLDGDAARRRTYTTALEQAEQLFMAAGSSGFETKPILLYYSVFQAGRALSALANTGPDWRLWGHGLQCSADTRERESDKSRTPFADIAVKMARNNQGKPPAGFPSLCQMLECDTLGGPTSLGRLIAAATRASHDVTPLFPGTEELPRVLQLDATVHFERTFSTITKGIPASVLEAGPDAVREFLLKHYSDFRDDPDWIVPSGDVHPIDGYCKLEWPDRPLDGATIQEQKQSAHAHAEAIAGCRLTSRSWQTFPLIDDSGNSTLHPLAAWWAILYTLSMLSRYSPSSWSLDLDVDKSQSAVAIEELIAKATSEVPRYVVNALRKLSPT